MLLTLDLINLNIQKKIFDDNSYVGTQTKTLGIIYKHKILIIVYNGDILTMDNFYLQYYLINIIGLIPSLLATNTFASSKDLQMIFNSISCTFE